MSVSLPVQPRPARRPDQLARRTGGAVVVAGLSGGLLLTGPPAALGAPPAGVTPAAGATAVRGAAATPAAVPAAITPSLHACTSDRRTISYGSRGSSVRYVQQRLDVHPRSGWFGPITRAAVKRYQRKHHLLVDGIVGPQTWRSLLCGSKGSDGGGGSYPGIPSRVQRLNWRALAQCESSGNPRALNPSGKYRGLYQFDFPTWRSVGGKGDPIDASVHEQTYRAMKLYVARSDAPWPQCGRRLYS